MEWLNQNAGAVQAISAAVIAVLTLVLVGATIWYARRTAQIAQATEKNVVQQALVAQLMRQDLEFRIAPSPRFFFGGGTSTEMKGEIKNGGPGVAVNLKAVIRFLPAGRMEPIRAPKYLAIESLLPFSFVLSKGEDNFVVEIDCTDSAGFMEYHSVWSRQGKLVDYRQSDPKSTK